MRRWLPLLLLLVLLPAQPSATSAAVQIPPVVISGESLPQPVHLAPADADLFHRRVNLPPRLDKAPEVTGPSYVVETPYWDDAIRRKNEREEKLTADLEATYYPQGGYVRSRLGDQDVWLVLDLRQRELLDRYVELAAAKRISDTPAALTVLQAAQTDTPIGIDAGEVVLTSDQRDRFWRDLSASNLKLLDPQQQPATHQQGFWLVFTLVNDDARQYFYDGKTLTDSLGTERVQPGSDLQSFLGSLSPGSPSISNEAKAGSLLWWPVMLGGAAIALGAAIWLQRRQRNTP